MPSRAALIALLVAAVVVLAGVIVVLVVLALPPAVANLTARVDTNETDVTAGRASVTVPAGWVVRRAPFRSEAVRLTSPDGRLDVDLSTSPGAPAAAFADAAPSATAPIAEPLRSGLVAVHAQTTDDTITAAVGDDDGAALIVATADGGIRPYARMVAGLLDTVRLARSAAETPR